MDNSSFNATYWEHWLLVVCSVGMAIGGLRVSWQWNRDARDLNKRSKLARRLAMELHDQTSFPSEGQAEGSREPLDVMRSHAGPQHKT